MPGEATPPWLPAFHFSLFFGRDRKTDNSFKEASGITTEIATEEVTCGGQNAFTYKLPGVTKYQNLVLKRGTMAHDTSLSKWITSTLQGGLAETIEPQKVGLMLLSKDAKPIIIWTFYGAYPIKWSVSDFNSMDNALSLETLEFSYQYFTRNINKSALK